MTTVSLRVLTVCTANICRSPVAEAAFQREFDRAGIAATVRSAGTRGGQLPIVPEVIQAASEIGLDVSQHRSRRLTAEIVRGADLIVAMTRDHLRVVVELDPESWPVTFTLKELARRSEPLAPTSMSVGEWIDALNAGRNSTDLLGTSADDDLEDPYGGPYEGYQEMVRSVSSLAKIAPLKS